MNPFVADPEWGWWIIGYFYLGGISAGCYLVATLIDMLGQDADRPIARLGYRIAFPLICICGVFLIVDLDRPERFWHMMFQSEVVEAALKEGWPGGGWGTMLHAPILKWWSAMSIGALAIGLYGLWSFLSFVTSFWTPRILAWCGGQNVAGHLFRVVGSGLGFFVASYTGVLLAATNQPVWSLSDWIAPLFLTSAASTAISALLLLSRGITPGTRERLERADLWALGLELFIFLLFLASLGGLLPEVLKSWQGMILVYGTLGAGLLAPLTLHLGLRQGGGGRITAAALFALLGGFLLRFGVVRIAPALLAAPPVSLPEALDVPLWEHLEGKILVALTVGLALAIPLLLRRQWTLSFGRTALAGIVSVLATGGVLFYTMQPLSARPALLSAFDHWSPEADRPRGGGVGASMYNRPADLKVQRSKFTVSDIP